MVPPGGKMEDVLNQHDLNSGVEYRSSNQFSWSLWEESKVLERAKMMCQPYLTGFTEKPLSDTTCHRQSLYQTDKGGICKHNRGKSWHLSWYNAHTTYCPTVCLGPMPVHFVAFLSLTHFLYKSSSWSSPEGKTGALHWTTGVGEDLSIYKRRCATAAARTIMGARTFAATIWSSVFIYLFICTFPGKKTLFLTG